MSKRIRYIKAGDSKLVSLRNFITLAGNTVVVELDTENKKFRVLDAATLAEVSSGGDTKNVAILKQQAKESLVSLGVTFSEEVRIREVGPGF